VRASLLALLAILLAAPQAQRSNQSRVRSATGDALDRYVGGDYDGAIGQLTYLGGFSTVDADEWIRKGGAADADRRRLVAASLALEVTAAKDAWPTSLIEWACDGFRAAGPPAPNEALWMRASVALAEGDGMWAILSPTAHLGHALQRFPDDPHFKLARAFVADAVASQPVVTTGTTLTDQTPVAFDRLASRMLDSKPDADARRTAFDRVAAEFQALAADPVVGAEARLRLGDLELRLGRLDRAADEFRQANAAAGRDPFISFLARLFLAWTDAQAGHIDDALRGYRSALEVVPRARSATTLLSALLVMNGRVGEAEEATTAFLSSPEAPAEDPWRQYPRGDFRAYSTLLGELHAAIKQ
jgi:tetratricopeptide (TPR) repeat protein